MRGRKLQSTQPHQIEFQFEKLVLKQRHRERRGQRVRLRPMFQQHVNVHDDDRIQNRSVREHRITVQQNAKLGNQQRVLLKLQALPLTLRCQSRILLAEDQMRPCRAKVRLKDLGQHGGVLLISRQVCRREVWQGW